MYKIIFIILMVLIFVFPVFGCDTEKVDTLSNSLVGQYVDIGYYNNKNSQIIDFTLFTGIVLKSEKSIIRYSLVPVSFVKRKSDSYRYSFKGAISYLGYVFFHLTAKEENEIVTLSLPLYLFCLPNISYDRKITNNFYLNLTTNTEYLLLKKNELDRGVLFTPSIGFTLLKGNSFYQSFTFSLNYTLFLNFDGENEQDGVGFKVNYSLF